MSAAAIGDLTVAVLFLIVVFFVIGVLTVLNFGWEGFKMAMAGKAYARTVRWLLAIITLAFILFMAWGEIMFAPNGIAPV
jgi:fatty acid desaturase